MEELKNRIKDYKQQALELLKNLIAFPTVLDEFHPNSEAPFGKANREALNYLLEVAKKEGFTTKNVDNYAGHIEFGSGSEILGILAHLDVVPVVENEWDSHPFTLSLRNGKMYARGAIDDKGPLVAAYMAMKILKDYGFEPKKRIRLIAGCDEESGSRCLSYYFEKEEKPQLGFSPDADFPLIYGEKGMMSYDIYGTVSDDIIEEFQCGERYNVVPSYAEMKLNVDLKKQYVQFLKDKGYHGEVREDTYIAYGVASHAMCPEKGVNASFILFEFLKDYSSSELSRFVHTYFLWDTRGEKMGYAVYDEDMKDLTSNLAVVSVKNHQFKIGVNCRIPLDSHFEVIEDCLKKACQSYGYAYKIISSSKRHYVHPDSDLVQTLMKCYQKVTGDYEHPAITIGGGTYAREIGNAVAFGPLFVGREDVCHIANEYMIEDDFYKAIEIYMYAIYELSKS